MKIAIVGTGYVGLVSGGLLRRNGTRHHLRGHRRKKNRRSERGHYPDLRAGTRRTRAAQRGGGTPALHHRPHEVPAPCRSGLLGRRDPARRGRFGRPEIRSRRGPHLRPPHPQIHRAGHQEHRARGYGAEGARRDRRGTRKTRLQGPVRRRLEPRVPEGRCGDQGLHVARPRGRGRRQRTGAQADGQALPAVPDHQFPRTVHGHPLGRNDQICRQCHARDTHLVHERDRQPMRPRGRRRGDGPQGHRFRRPHRQQVPLPRLRLRRLMLPEGREGAGPHGPGTRLHDAGHRGRRAGQRAAERGWFSRNCGLRWATCGARSSQSGAWPSSPRPTTCARPRQRW